MKKFYNNADCFSNNFEVELKKLRLNKEIQDEELIKLHALKELENHPYFIENPKMAKVIADFRMRLNSK